MCLRTKTRPKAVKVMHTSDIAEITNQQNDFFEISRMHEKKYSQNSIESMKLQAILHAYDA